MPHKIDRKRHMRNVRNKRRALKKRYMKITQGDTVDPEKALTVLKDSGQVELAKRLARRLSARMVFVRFAGGR